MGYVAQQARMLALTQRKSAVETNNPENNQQNSIYSNNADQTSKTGHLKGRTQTKQYLDGLMQNLQRLLAEKFNF